MASNSKVWPILVESSLNLDSHPATVSGFIPESNSSYFAIFSTIIYYLKALKKCIPINADVFCVTGAIIATTGALVACFGIYPGNQARTRLYLECVGCGMVIFGSIAIVLSYKARGKTIIEDCFDESDFKSRCNIVQSALSNITKREKQLQNSKSLSSVLSDSLNEQHQPFPLLRELKNSSTCLTDEELESLAGAQILGIECGINHQVAVESALSSVLSVSTLVGFRSDQNDVERLNRFPCNYLSRKRKQRWFDKFRIARIFQVIQEEKKVAPNDVEQQIVSSNA